MTTTISYEKWRELSESFANEASKHLSQLCAGFEPDDDVEPAEAHFDEETLRSFYRISMAESLLLLARVEPPTSDTPQAYGKRARYSLEKRGPSSHDSGVAWT